MANPVLTKAFVAGNTIAGNRIVFQPANDDGVTAAGNSSDLSIGITESIDVVTGERVDVILVGIADLKLGGSVARGQLVTSGAAGVGVAAITAGTDRVIGVALASGVSGDIIPVLVAPSVR